MLLRRRRTMRVAGSLLFLALVAGLMAYSGAKKGSGGGPGNKAAAKLTCPEVDAPNTTPETFDEAPAALELGVDYRAVIKTSCGDIELDLLEDVAPRTVANFVFLAENGFYDGLIWHRIERDFVIETGDPDGLIGSGNDGPGYTIRDELPDSEDDYVYGVVAMASDSSGAAGSRFFIVVHDPDEKKEPAGIQTDYSIFGQVAESSYEVLDKIARMPVKGGDDVPTAVKPLSPVVVETIEISRN